jgi:hypothetical protein
LGRWQVCSRSVGRLSTPMGRMGRMADSRQAALQASSCSYSPEWRW